MSGEEIEQEQGESERPLKARHERVRFTPEQQAVFDREFRKREAKIRRQYEPMHRDLFDTVDLTVQLLERCSDRISLADQRAIHSGLNAIRLEYEEKKWQKQ